ncbi:MAG: DUF934 domain-containing protein [Lautropia sp.]
MPVLIDANGVPLADRWSLLDPSSVRALATQGLPPNVGVLLEPSDDPAIVDTLGPDVRLALVAVRFPAATDGRGYSIARLLRQRHRWQGPIRATGDVARDQLAYLRRCGFDQFLLRDGETPEAARAALAGFSERYQASSDGGPLFARRAA